MKLLFVDFTLPQLMKDANFPAGGWAVQLRQLLVSLGQAGHRAGVLTWKGANAYVGTQSVCDLIETYDPALGIRKVRPFTYFLPALYHAARAYRPDVIIQSCANVQTATMALIAWNLQIPFVHRIASDSDADGRNARYLRLGDRIAFACGLRSCRLVVCQNSYQLEHIRKRFPGKATCKIHNAIQLPSAVTRLRWRRERNYVAWLGNFARRKNMPLLLRIAQELPQIEFRVAGMLPDEAAQDSTLLALDKLRHLENVKFVGYLRRTEVWDFLSGAIALLSTADFEGFSNTFLESFATGTPVVLRSIVDPDAIVRNNALGLVAEDGQDIVRCVREICAMPADLHEAMGRNCRRYVETYHTPDAAARKLISALYPITIKQVPLDIKLIA